MRAPAPDDCLGKSRPAGARRIARPRDRGAAPDPDPGRSSRRSKPDIQRNQPDEVDSGRRPHRVDPPRDDRPLRRGQDSRRTHQQHDWPSDHADVRDLVCGAARREERRGRGAATPRGLRRSDHRIKKERAMAINMTGSAIAILDDHPSAIGHF